MQHFQVKIIDEIEDVLDDNADVQVELADGKRYVATFFTIANIQRIMKKDEGPGECLHGTYFWCSDMLIVKDLRPETIEASIQDLLKQEEFEHVFLLCPPREEREDG